MKSGIRIFLEKGCILVITSVNLETKGVNFDVQCFTMKRGVHLGWKVSVLAQKGVIFKLENKDEYHFFQWVREPGVGYPLQEF